MKYRMRTAVSFSRRKKRKKIKGKIEEKKTKYRIAVTLSASRYNMFVIVVYGKVQTSRVMFGF